MVFDVEQEAATHLVTLTTGEGQNEKRVQTQRTQDPKVYRSEPIQLTERAAVQP